MGVLTGVRVVDLGRYIAGPLCSSLLGDLGADVIRIERPGGGEDRDTLPLAEDCDAGAPYLSVNRNKRGMTLEIGSPDGRAILRKLIATADIVVVNLPFPTLKNLGLDYDSLKVIKEDIILVHTSAFGTDGPYAEWVGFDGVGQVMSGSAYMAGDEAGGPRRAGVAWVDVTTAMFNAYGALAAIMHKRATGEGQRIETNLFRSALNQTNATIIEQAVIEKNRVPTGNRAQGAGPGDIHPTKDGWVLTQVIGDVLFGRWARMMGDEALLSDPRFATDDLRGRNNHELSERMNAWTAERTTAEVMDLLSKAKIPAGPVYTPQQVLDDEHVAAANLYRQMDYPGLPRPAPIVEQGARFSSIPLGTGRPPTVGEHTDQVLAEIGLSVTDIAGLRDKGVI